MTELTLFASTFVLVFALGAQSLNVNNGHYHAAAVTSFAIGSMQMILFKLAPDASELGRLCEMIQQQVEISMIEPPADTGEQAEL